MRRASPMHQGRREEQGKDSYANELGAETVELLDGGSALMVGTDLPVKGLDAADERAICRGYCRNWPSWVESSRSFPPGRAGVCAAPPCVAAAAGNSQPCPRYMNCCGRHRNPEVRLEPVPAHSAWHER